MTDRRRYTPDEDRVLLAHAGRKPIHRIAALVGRSPRSVRCRLILHGWIGERSARHRLRQSIGGWRRAGIAALFCVDPHSVDNWIAWGWLPVHCIRTVEPAVYFSDMGDVITFLERGGALLPYLNPADAFWIGMIAEVRADLDRQYIRRDALADVLMIGRRAIAHLITRLHFPAPTIARAGMFAYFDRAAVRAWLAAHPRYQTSRTEADL